ncbi:Ig-like domain-containing protein [Arthrobacter sp. NPDC058288]|uniref:Ig-like domain-containing protein n=1 Tax=Arthrobacter sp. NPDC058288 TaxID=3346424 RepID=UPI0036EC0533
MPLSGTLFSKRGKVVQATGFSAIAAFLAAAAILYPGVESADVDLNDGGVWVTNKTLSMTARLNYPSQALDGGVTPPGTGFDVVQHAGEVFIDDGATLTPVDPAAMRLETPLELPAGVRASAGQGSYVLSDTGSGEAWVASAGSVAGFTTESEPVVTGAKNLVAMIGADGAAYVADSGAREVTRIVVNPDGNPGKTEKVAFADFSAAKDLQLTTVGSRPVLLDGDTGTVYLPGGRTAVVPGGKGALLQHSGADSGFVAVATPGGLFKQPLNGDPASSQQVADGGLPAKPVQLDGCVHSAWHKAALYVRDCEDDAYDKRSGIPGADKKSELVFRVNRSLVVLNDTNGGNVWLVQKEMQLVNNWQDLQTPPNKSEEEKEDAADQNPLTQLPDRTQENRKPNAQDDEFGVRPGKTTLLTPLDNDSDPDGDLLTMTVLGPGPGNGQVTPIYNGSAMQLAVPAEASGTSTFGYQVEDGRGKSAQAKVTVRVRQASENGPPTQKRKTVILLEQGKSISQNVLADWADPDGDDLFLRSATADNGSDQVQARADGLLQFQDIGTSTGQKTVILRVSDGQAEAEGKITVDVRPRGTLPPVANPDHISVVAGQDVVVSPLENDLDPAGASLRLARVDGPSTARVTPHFDAGTFVFNAASAGTYYVTYQVTNGPASQLGLVRIDATNGASSGAPIAVRDVARLPQGGQTLVDALANDIDPAGGVMVIQSVTVPPGSPLSVAILDHSVLRVTDARGATAPTTFSYTVSNGRETAVGEVTVQPVPAPATLRPPRALPDEITVRANDVAAVHVLANDVHPDGAELTLNPKLAQTIDPADGMLGVSGDVLRFKAGPAPKTVHAIYVVAGPDGQESSAQVTIRIKGGGEDQNSRPEPHNLTARTIAGSTTRIQVPLEGVDPDGDSVELIGLDKAPAQGTVVVGTTYLEYTAAAKASGQDTFSYVVQDTFGVRNTATVAVGIGLASGSNQQPVAGDDAVTLLPGRNVAVNVLMNDADPDGDPVSLVRDGIEADAALGASTGDGRVRFTTPAEASAVVLRYKISDGRGGTATGTLKVNVRTDAPRKAPVARDDRVSFAETLGKTAVDVPVLKNDEDPDGVSSDLRITTGAEETGVSVRPNGSVNVTLSPKARIIPYTVTDPDGLGATAFIRVPGTSEQRPALKDSTPLEVVSGKVLTVDLDSLVLTRKDRAPRITVDSRVSAVAGSGSPLVQDEDTLLFTSADDYAGPASLTFEVADGPVDAPDTLTAVLTIGIKVLPDPDRNHPPVFSSSKANVVRGEESVVDLAELGGDPDEADQGKLKFSLVPPLPNGVTATIDGSSLKVTAGGESAAEGSRVAVSVADPRGLSSQGTVELLPTPSLRPLPVANDDVIAEARAGENRNIDVLANDVDPFPDSGLKLLRAVVETGDGSATVAGGTVDVRPSETFVGTMVVRYRIQDKTGDPQREADGRIRLTVKAKPGKPGTPVATEVRDRTVVLNWTPPPANGSPITGYRVTTTAGVSKMCPTNTCTVDGLTNDVEYVFSVVAVNGIGDSPASDPSAPARPDQRPEAPQAPTLAFGDKQLSISWPAATSTGSAISEYELQLSPAPPSGQTVRSAGPGLSFTWSGLANGTSYRVQLRAKNKAPEPSDWSPFSAAETPAGVPAVPATPTTTLATSGAASSVIQVNWSAPEGNGDAVTEYTVVSAHAGSAAATQVVPGNRTSAAFSVGNSDTGYTFTVAARNKAGYSAASPRSDARRAVGAPGPVDGLRADPLDNSAQLTFSGPGTTGGAAAGETVYEYRVNGGQVAVVPASKVIPGLANNGTYTIGVRATNIVDGQSYPGPFSDANPVAPFGKPLQAITDGFHYGTSQVRTVVTPPAANGRPVAGFEWTSRYPDEGRDGPSGTLPAGGGEILAGDKPDQNVQVFITTLDSEGHRSDVLQAGGRTYQNVSFAVNGEFGGLCAWTSRDGGPADNRVDCLAAGGDWIVNGTRVSINCSIAAAGYTFRGAPANLWAVGSTYSAARNLRVAGQTFSAQAQTCPS